MHIKQCTSFIQERTDFMGKKERFYADVMATHPGVTGSNILVIAHYPDERKTKFIVDAGLFQEAEYSKYNENFVFNPKNIEFCAVTHNHVDHTGRLPLLEKLGFTGKVYTSRDTGVLLKHALADAYKVLKGIAKRTHTKELYSGENTNGIQKRVKTLEFLKKTSVSENIDITLLENGHLSGAAMVLVQIHYPEYPDINILFTGDYNSENVFFDVAKIPDEILELPITIVQESTYGTTDSKQKVECFEKNVLDCIKDGGTAVNMAFSLGRFQEVLYKLKQMQDEGKLSKDIPIYADGKLGILYTMLMEQRKIKIKDSIKSILPENIHWVNKTNREEVLRSNDCKIIVTTSGMGTYGPAPRYITTFIRNEKNLIQFTGYTTEGTLGARLKNAEDGDVVKISGMFAVKRAKVEYTTEFSAHAKADELIAFLNQFKNIKLVLVNHGEPDVKDKYAKRVVKETNAKDVGVLGRDYMYRIGPCGIIKTMSSKFE